MMELDIDDEPMVAYLAPQTVDEAIALLAEYGDDAKIVAGGQSLFVLLRQGLIQPSVLISLKRIPELTAIETRADGGLSIGSMVTQHTLATDPAIAHHYPALSEAAVAVASPPIRRQGTLGGNLCHADPTADPPAVLIALGATLELASEGSRRHIPVEEFFADYMEPALEPGELLIAAHLPAPAKRSGAAYLKHRVRAIDTALVSAGVGLALAADGDVCVDARIGLAGAGATPVRAHRAEAELRGRTITLETIANAARVASEECEPLSDTEGSEWYRREMIAVFVRRAGDIALHRARGA